MADLIAQAVLLAFQVLVFVLIIKPWLLRQLHIVARLVEVIRQITAFLK